MKKNEIQVSKRRQINLKKIKNEFQPPPLIETKNEFKHKEPRQLKQKAQAPIGRAGRVHMDTKVSSERPECTF